MSSPHIISPPALIAPQGTAKARIERAALELFTNGSIEAGSTKAIAAAANVSEGLIYRHYKNKDALARALMHLIHIRLTEMIEAAEGMSLKNAVWHIITSYCDEADQDWTLFRYHILHLHRFAGITQACGKSPHSAACAIISRAQDSRVIICRDDPNLLAALCLGLVLQTAQAKVIGAITQPLSTYSRRFETSVMAILNQE